MVLEYLAVELDDAVHVRESAFWLSHGISSVRVTSMNEAIEKARANQYLYIGINADNINYKPLLRVLRDVTNDPIFIATSNYSTQEHAEASNLGADLYGKAGDTPEVNYGAVIAKINQLNDRAKQRKKLIKTLYHDNVLIVPSFRQVFFNEIPITLTKKEFDMLYFFMRNRLMVLSFQQIFRNVWGNDHCDASHEIIRNHVKRINAKFNAVLPKYNFIVNQRGVGYKLKQLDCKKQCVN